MNEQRVGGSEGGGKLFLLGVVLAVLSGWFFVDSVQVSTFRNGGLISRGFGGFGETGGSMGVLFLPLMIGVALLFYDAKKTVAWVVTFLGLALVGIEVLSRIRFLLDLKLSHLLLMLVGFSAGIGMIFRALRNNPPQDDKETVASMVAEARRQGAKDAKAERAADEAKVARLQQITETAATE